MSKFVTYITKDNDRLDIIATLAYGSPHAHKMIVDANPNLPLTPVYSAGILVAVPVVENTTEAVVTNLPPWKR